MLQTGEDDSGMIVLHLLFTAADWVLWLLDAAVLIYVVLSWMRPKGSKWMLALARICEPMLAPARRLIGRLLPSRFMIIDWSPVLVIVALGVVRRLLGLVERTLS